jgi:hypothetical protein
MANMQMRAVKRTSSVARFDAVSIAGRLDAPADPWGRAIPTTETEDEEIERLLLPLNWLCDLLEQMSRSPSDTAGLRSAFDELMARLRQSSRSTLVQRRLDDAAKEVAAGRHRDAMQALRGLMA